MNLYSIWSLLEQSFDILGGYGYPAMDNAAEEFALSPDYFTWISAIWLFGAEAFTIADFMRIFPYGLPRVNAERFASAMQKGYFISDGNGRYTCTENGNEVARTIWRAAGDSLADLASIPFENLQSLFGYLDRLIHASLSAPEEKDTLKKISTWPWEADTMRGFVSSVGLPILLYLITTFLGRLIK
jgi:hypothetical protein